jgi:hypothetical protein
MCRRAANVLRQRVLARILSSGSAHTIPQLLARSREQDIVDSVAAALEHKTSGG